MHVDKLNLILDVKKPRMSVAKIFNNNRILSKFFLSYLLLSFFLPYTIFSLFPTDEATNLFLKENGHEILKAMQPQLQKKLASEFAGIANQLLKHVTIEKFLRD